MSNIIDKIQLSGVTYDIVGQGGSGVSVVEVTQAEYDALPTSAKTDTSKMYIISDAQAGDLTNYYTKSETSGATEISTALNAKADTATTYTKTEVDNAITAATSTKQDTLVSGTNIKTINNESILGSGNITIQGGGGGKAVSGGTNISITTGATADTINCTLPISRGQSGYNSLSLGGMSDATEEGAVSYGYHSVAYGLYALAGGSSSNANGSNSVAIGSNVTTNNDKEFSVGQYNLSSSASTDFGDSGNTLFSVGNGEYSRHNAIEVRQNGDIYISDTSASGEFDEKPMIKLQDALGQGGGGSSVTVDPSLDSGSTNPVANSAITNNTLSGYVETSDYFRAVRLWRNNGTVAFYKRFAAINGKSVMVDGITEAPDFQLVETSAITTSVTSSSTDAQVPSAKAVNDKLGGLSLIKLTQAEYDALTTKDSNTLYIITDS